MCLKAMPANIEDGIISVDVAKKIATWTSVGQPEKYAPLYKGPEGFCTADFGWGPMKTETPNLLFDVAPEHTPNQNGRPPKRPAPEPIRKPAAQMPKFSHKSKAQKGEDVENLDAEQPEKKTVNKKDIFFMHACVASLVSLSLCVFVSAHFICVCACSAGPLHIRDLQVGNLLDEKLYRIPTKAWREKTAFLNQIPHTFDGYIARMGRRNIEKVR